MVVYVVAVHVVAYIDNSIQAVADVFAAVAVDAVAFLDNGSRVVAAVVAAVVDLDVVVVDNLAGVDVVDYASRLIIRTRYINLAYHCMILTLFLTWYLY